MPPRGSCNDARDAQGRALRQRRGRAHALRRRRRGRRADQARHRHPARRRAIRLAARLAAVSVRRDQQQRIRIRTGGDRASRHRVSHRPRQWRAHQARRGDPAAHAPDPHDHGHPVGEHPGRVQQSERAARLSHQPRLHARRGSEAAGPDRRRHLRASGARHARQPAGDPGHARQRRHPDQGRRPRRAQGLRLQERCADQRGVDRPRRRQGLRAAASRFSSDEALDVRLDRDPEQDVHVQDGRRPDQSGDRLPRGNAGRAEEPPIASGGGHGPRASERPVSVRGESRPGHGRFPGQEGVQGRREQHRRLLDRPVHRRADARSSTSRRAPSIRARSTSIRADACSWPSTIFRWT